MTKPDLRAGPAAIEDWTKRTFDLVMKKFPYDKWDREDKMRGLQKMRTILSSFLLGQTIVECAQRLAGWVRVEKSKLPEDQQTPLWNSMEQSVRQSFITLAEAGYKVLDSDN